MISAVHFVCTSTPAHTPIQRNVDIKVKQMHYNRAIKLALVSVVVLFLTDCGRKVRYLSLDFPHGETRLWVRAGGEARLYYGALPDHHILQEGVFNVDDLYARLRPLLHKNVPAEQRPDPGVEYGMVSIRFNSGKRVDYLLFDRAFTEALFERGRRIR